MAPGHRVRGTRRRVLAAGRLAAASALLGACGTAGSTAKVPAARPLRSGVTLTYHNSGNAPGKLLVDQVIANWGKRYPGIAIDFIWGGNEEKLQSLFAADTPPDVFAMSDVLLADFAARGSLVELEPLMRRDKIDTADIYERSLRAFQFKGKQFGLPRAFNSAVMYTNVGLFKEAGVPLPSTDWKSTGWDLNAFRDACQRLTRRDGNDTTQWGANLVNNDWYLSLILANGGHVLSKDQTRCTIAEPPALEALEYLEELLHRQRVAQTPAVQRDAGGPRNLFMTGKCAMELFGSSNLNLYRQINGFEWDWTILPRGRSARAAWGGGAGWSNSKASQHQEEAWTFLQHITNRESVTIMSEQYFPYRRSSLNDVMAADTRLPPKNRQAVADGMASADGWPVLPRRQEIQQALDTHLGPVWAGQQPARAAAQAAARAIDGLLRAA